ncbi:MAG: glutaredoxin domain-containing protein [Gammaproteobacteria bacterium]|nr:glutaredoxin domain-containing protein [Gammaproteobacteria bacterium]
MITDSPRKSRPGNKRGGFFIIAIFVVAIMIFSRHEEINTIDCTPDIMANKPDVVMLGAWWCTYCYQAKKYFQKNNIDYCEYDMEHTDEGKRLYQASGGGAVPVLLVGEYQLNGFSYQQVDAALALLNKTQKN